MAATPPTPRAPAPTLDQRRAAHAWKCVTQHRCDFDGEAFKDYRNFAKGAPALVMGSGLMAALAFWQSRGTLPARAVAQNVLSWLAREHPALAQFERAMEAMAGGIDARRYMALTDDALALLRWLRQFADAVEASS